MCFKVGTVYFSLKVYRSEVLAIATAPLQHIFFFRQFQCVFGGLFCFGFFLLEFEQKWMRHTHTHTPSMAI